MVFDQNISFVFPQTIMYSTTSGSIKQQSFQAIYSSSPLASCFSGNSSCHNSALLSLTINSPIQFASILSDSTSNPGVSCALFSNTNQTLLSYSFDANGKLDLNSMFCFGNFVIESGDEECGENFKDCIQCAYVTTDTFNDVSWTCCAPQEFIISNELSIYYKTRDLNTETLKQQVFCI